MPKRKKGTKPVAYPEAGPVRVTKPDGSVETQPAHQHSPGVGAGETWSLKYPIPRDQGTGKRNESNE